MALNPYFNHFTANNEQSLMADLIVESIQQYGYSMIYLPRTQTNFDDLYNQDDMSEFNSAYTIEMYIKSVDAFEGEGTFLSKFGLEVRDRVTLSVARRTFDTVVGTPATLPRPREGDLIFFTMTNKIFEIVYVDNRAIFYPLGALPLYDIQAEVYEYNGEKFNTGVAAIDAIAAAISVDRNAEPQTPAVFDDEGNVVPDFDEEDRDVEYDNNFIQTEANTLIDHSIFDPFSGGDL